MGQPGASLNSPQPRSPRATAIGGTLLAGPPIDASLPPPRAILADPQAGRTVTDHPEGTP